MKGLTGRKKVSDRIKIADMLHFIQMMSLNQKATPIKLTKIWNALNDS